MHKIEYWVKILRIYLKIDQLMIIFELFKNIWPITPNCQAMMKKIQAIIRATKYEDVRDALHKIGVEFFIFYEVKGVSFQNELKGSYRGM